LDHQLQLEQLPEQRAPARAVLPLLPLLLEPSLPRLCWQACQGCQGPLLQQQQHKRGSQGPRLLQCPAACR